MPCRPTGFNIYLEIGTVICRPGTGGRGKMRIAICEDNQEHANVLKGMIQKWAETEEIKVDMNYYESAEQFLYYWEKGEPYDLIFMDIQMNRMNGMELARYIRQQDRAVFIIFTSGLLNYVFKGYEVSAFRFLRKPLQEKDVLAALKKTYYEVEEGKREAVIIPTEEGSLRVFKQDIYYVEADNHYIIMHTKQGDFHYKEKLGNVEPMFPEPTFCKCHRSYIINLHHMGRLMKDEVEIDNGDTLPVSKARWVDLNECFF